MAVTGLGDRALGARRARGVLGGNQAQVGADAAPVNRCQSPISTANANAVSTETPRRHASRRTTGVNSQSAAIAVIFSSSRSRRPVASTTASYASSNAAWVPTRSNRWRTSHPSCATVHAFPPEYTIPCRSSSLDNRCRARIRSARAASRARTRSRAASCDSLGTPTETTSSRRSSRARCNASRASVFTRAPAGRCNFEGATTSHLTPSAVNARHKPGTESPRSVRRLDLVRADFGGRLF